MKRVGAVLISALFLLNGTILPSAIAEQMPTASGLPTLGISQTFNDPQLSVCADVIYQSLLVSHITSEFNFLPNWYMAQGSGLLDAEDPDLWRNTYQRLPDLQQVIVLRVASDYKHISAVWVLNQEQNIEIHKAETVMIEQFSDVTQLSKSCFLLSQKLRGNTQPERFRSPFLSAGLSLMIPGAGHFYRNTSEGLVWGSVFLLSYLSMSFLALSDSTALSYAQWGGLILSSTLIDALSAYFFTASAES